MLITTPTLTGVNDAHDEKAATSTLQIEVRGLDPDQGLVRVSVFNSADAWLKKPLYSAALVIKETRALWTIDELPYGDYAVSFYQDLNENGELDTGLMRLPVEPYGFSNAAAAAFGPPGWKAARIRIDRPHYQVTLSPQ